MAVLPESVGLAVTAPYVSRTSNTWLIDWDKKQVIGMGDELSAVCQAIDIALLTERYKWQIYSSDFGSEINALIGEEEDYVVSELPRRVQDALSVDDRILAVELTDYELQGGKLHAKFDIETVYGSVRREVTA